MGKPMNPVVRILILMLSIIRRYIKLKQVQFLKLKLKLLKIYAGLSCPVVIPMPSRECELEHPQWALISLYKSLDTKLVSLGCHIFELAGLHYECMYVCMYRDS